MSVRRTGDGVPVHVEDDEDPEPIPDPPARTNQPKIPTSSVSHQPIEKLRGRDDYAAWAFGMRMVMIKEGTWCAVNPPADKQISEELSDRALATICLSIERYNYSLVQNARSAKEAWKSLQTAFQDSGKYRKISLLRKLMRMELEDCSTVEEYVDEILTTSQKLQDIGFPINDEWLSLVLMMGLPKRYEPMVMGMDASGIEWTADWVKSKILQDVTIDGRGRSSGALAARPNRPAKKKDKAGVQCYKCEKYGHYASECPEKQPKPKNGKDEKGSRGRKSALLAVKRSIGSSPEEWILDSGAGDHMCRQENVLVDAEQVSQSIYVADAAELAVVAVGNVEVEAHVNGECSSLEISNVLCVPELAVNLLSVSRICKKGYRVTFTSQSCTVMHEATGVVIATGRETDGLYKLNQMGRSSACVARQSTNLELWHRRLGHLNVDSVKRLPSMVTGMDIPVGTMSSCVPCIEGKHQKSPFKSKSTRTSEVLELVHSDLCGPMEKASIGGSKYFATFIDDASRMVFIYFLKTKGEAFNAFQDFKAYSETQTGKKLKCFRTDNGKEFVGKQFEDFLKTHGIRHETTVPYNPEQNGLAERMNRTIQERARCLMFDGQMDKKFWAEASSTAVYLINRSPTKGIAITPYEKFTGKKPDLSNLRVFGSKAMAHVPKVKRKKWDAKSTPCTLVGYSECSKAYRVYSSANNEVFESRDVIILDEGLVTKETLSNHSEPGIGPMLVPDDSEQTEEEENEEEEKSDDRVSVGDEEEDLFGFASDGEPVGPEDHQPLALPSQLSQNSSLRRSVRERKFPGKYSEFHVTYSVLPQKLVASQKRCHPEERMQPGSSSITALPSHLKEEAVDLQHDSGYSDWERPVQGKLNSEFDSGSNLSPVCNPQALANPDTVQQALDRPDRDQWIAAMQAEYRALCDNETWCLVDLPKGRKALKNKWVFKLKTNGDGTIERYKARLVIKGYSQVKGVDYSETYSPVVRYATVRYLLAMAAQYDLQVHQMDAVTAFLQGDLDDEEIFMEQPEGFQDDRAPRKVCRLKKALYGLKQASRVWNRKLDQKLQLMGMKRSKYDTCVYYRIVDGKLIIVAVYVDDFLILSNDRRLVDSIKQQLCAEFQMKDLGQAKQILGLQLTRSEDAVSIDQERYIDELLEKFKMQDCNPVSTPLDVNQRLSKEMCPKNEEEKERMKKIPFRELIGGLQFIAQCTRPDISHAVSVVSSYCSDPGFAHWTAAKRILRYLQGTKNFKLSYRKESNVMFSGYSDADWGNDPETRRSFSGYVFVQSGGAVSWSSRKQATVALSTTEAEYMALSSVTQEAIWWKGFLAELYGAEDSIIIKCDNKSAISLAEKEIGYSARTKHIDIRHHFVREQVEMKSIKLEHVTSNLQAADILTKALPGSKLREDRKTLGLNEVLA